MANVAQFKSHAQWWQDAGVSLAGAERPVLWFGTSTEVDEPREPHTEKVFAEQRTQPQTQNENSAPILSEPVAWPADLNALRIFLADEHSYPGAQYGHRRALPQGEKNAKLAIVTDFPSAGDIEQSRLLSGAEGKLLDAMLCAIALERSDCYIMSLATTRPASGELAERDRAALVDFAKHHLCQAAVGHVLLLGDAVSRFMLDIPIMESRGTLRIVNHDGSKMTVANCFHPRTLLARPRFKKQAWQDLQLLMKELDL